MFSVSNKGEDNSFEFTEQHLTRLDYLAACYRFLDLSNDADRDAYFMILRHGTVCAEGCWSRIPPKESTLWFSFGKSITPTAIGFAERKGSQH
jgi:hypothetical protein